MPDSRIANEIRELSWAVVWQAVSQQTNTRLHCCLAIRWLQGRQMLNSKQQLPLWRMVRCNFLCLKECRRKWGQLVFRLLNSTVQICPGGEVDCFHFSHFLHFLLEQSRQPWRSECKHPCTEHSRLDRPECGILNLKGFITLSWGSH